MNKRSRKLLFAIGAIALLTLMLVAARRGPSMNDIPLVQGIEPITSELWPQHSTFPTNIIREYSLHLPYDDAVKTAQAQLASSGWTCGSMTYGITTFRARKGDENIVIMRGRYFTPASMPSSIGVLTLVQLPSHFDPHGWVVITTFRKIDFFGAREFKVMRWIANRGHPTTFPIGVAIPIPKIGSDAQRVDVSKGTAQMESANLVFRCTTGTK